MISLFILCLLPLSPSIILSPSFFHSLPPSLSYTHTLFILPTFSLSLPHTRRRPLYFSSITLSLIPFSLSFLYFFLSTLSLSLSFCYTLFKIPRNRRRFQENILTQTNPSFSYFFLNLYFFCTFNNYNPINFITWDFHKPLQLKRIKFFLEGGGGKRYFRDYSLS